jgi:alpha-L-arabinofuranosidase
MKLKGLLLAAAAISCSICSMAQNKVFIYSPNPGAGLHIAVEEDSVYKDLGTLCSSDYGTWGVEKKMYHPSLCRANDGTWRLVFQVNDHSPLFAASYSKDLVTWRPQDYLRVSTPKCLSPVVHPVAKSFNVYYKTDEGAIRRVSASYDFRRFEKDMSMPFADIKLWNRDTTTIDGHRVDGQWFMLSDSELESVKSHFQTARNDRQLTNERMHNDAQTLSLPTTMEATLTVYPDSQKTISDKLIGIFFEDISYAADGGLYAELIQNRDFEYNERDHSGWTATTAWQSSSEIKIAHDYPLTPQNPNYAIVSNRILENTGWDGIPVKQGQRYDFSMFVRGKKTFIVTLRGEDGSILGTTRLKTKGNEWQQFSCVIEATKSDDKAHLELMPEGTDEVFIDMVSLFPQETFKNRKNGLRKDLAQVIADLKPKFVRFPGGCMSHGQGLENIYHWNHTVGSLQSRKPDFNIWHYHQTRGLGFFEFFQFCEDIGAEPLPVLAAGVPCQNSANNAEGIGGQQGGIPMEQMPAYVEEICNLIEWANGDPATNEWAKIRAEAGHPEPFNLKYLGLGNEDIISTVFEERYEMLCKAIRQRYPDIKICGTVGPFHSPSADYTEGWDFTKKHPDLQYMVDEHYYESTGWFMHHRNYYDLYDRQAPKVYLGEWAASTHTKRPNVETALAEALYLTDIERNGDVVEMTSYAPMLCKDGHSNWNPDMIYFSNTNIRTTPAYEIQRLFSVYSGDRYVSSHIQLKDSTSLSHRIGASVVSDSKTGSRYLKLVNALPTTLQVTVNGLTINDAQGEQFAGQPEMQDVKAQPIVLNDGIVTLPPYSLTVVKL